MENLEVGARGSVNSNQTPPAGELSKGGIVDLGQRLKERGHERDKRAREWKKKVQGKKNDFTGNWEIANDENKQQHVVDWRSLIDLRSSPHWWI